ncbi:MAG: MotA/TolQ/ExbB proton channel family protein [Opitutaceae bacterium]
MRAWVVTGFFLSAVTAFGAEPLEQALELAALDYAKRIESVSRELTEARAQTARERAPLAAAVREVEDRLVALEVELIRLQTFGAQADGLRTRRQRENEAVGQSLTYMSTLAQENLKVLESGLLPGESVIYASQIETLRGRLERAASAGDPDAGLELIDLSLARTRRALGGGRLAGKALADSGNRVTEGMFTFFGPEVFFSGPLGEDAGVVRTRAGAPYPVVHLLPDWKSADAAALGSGPSVLPTDPSGGRALRLRQVKGTFVEHVHKGGIVAYVIIAVGILSLVITVLKLNDARNLRVDGPRRVRPILSLVAEGKIDQAGQLVPSMQSITREVFSVGLQHIGKSKEALEEHLIALIQEQRLHFERRLPLLTVIATASPLLGLLGTVMGMVKTFSLITVFGTGNAAKLSTGISEVLVTTELGLAVAIPTLVIHGFLAHHIQKKLSLLDRHASEFVAAAEEARTVGLNPRATLV